LVAVVVGVATSKSVDLTASTCQSASRLSSTLTGYVDKAAGFNGEVWDGETITASDIEGPEPQRRLPIRTVEARHEFAQQLRVVPRDRDLDVVAFAHSGHELVSQPRDPGATTGVADRPSHTHLRSRPQHPERTGRPPECGGVRRWGT